ncbi:MAG: translation initiation factor IF-3 [Nevskiaceae bacterium]|nr:MAG: translation initiation factor IF-3 [Nevskiaceae bacterium]TBR74065.1 MAG: translation initiation factor IF-3 [Nevskiaceae bacterium]
MSAERKDRRNGSILAPRVRLIDAEGNQVGVVDTHDAMARAEEAGLELVEISPNADPPVCKIMDYGKFVYQKDKQQQAARKKQKQVQIKEVKFRPSTDENDFQTKLRNAIRFLEEGNKVKLTIRYRGREMAHQDRGFDLIDRITTELGELAQVEQTPRREGRQTTMVVTPRKR